MSVRELSERDHLINVASIPKPGAKFQNCLLAECERFPLQDPHRVTRRVAKTGAFVISAVAKIPFFAVSEELGPIIGPISATGNSLGFLILEYWAAKSIIDDFLGPKTAAEITLLERQGRKSKEVCRIVSVIFVASLLALFSQVPTALPGMVYNEDRYKYAAGAVLLVAGALIPIRSLQLTFEYLRLAVQSSFDAKANRIKRKMVNLIRSHQVLFIQKSRQRKIAFIQLRNQVCGINSSLAKTNQYALTFIHREEVRLTRTQKIVGGIFNYTGMGVGIIMSSVFEYAIGDYTFTTSKQEVWDNDIAAGVFSAVTVGTTFYLFGQSIINTSRKFFNFFGNLAVEKETRNLGWQLRPKISFTLSGIGLLIDVCALGPTYVIWGNYYNEEESEVKHELFQKTVLSSIFLVLLTSTLDIIDDIVTFSVGEGTAESQEILKVNNEFQKLASLIEKAPSREFIGYLTGLEDNERNELLRRVGVTSNQLALCARMIT